MPILSPETNSQDLSQSLQEQVQEAIQQQSPLFIHGGKSKLFYGNAVDAKPLDISAHSGVINYEPCELCITVRAGTLLSELEALLAENQQILPFEPPHYSEKATIGGAIAAGISGPRRAYTGSVRDAILGVQIINGEGEIANFGGQVMKNVAGYDVSRLMVRSQGTLGVILNVSLRLLPKPEANLTLSFEAEQHQALAYFKAMRTQQLPITATVWHDELLSIRLSASENILKNSKQTLIKNIATNEMSSISSINKECNEQENADNFWQSIRDHQHPFFQNENKPLWRFSLPPSSEKFTRIDNQPLIEWGGAQRWVQTNMPTNIIQNIASSRKGYATLFKGDLAGVPHFPVLEENLLKLHKSLKQKMDPHGIFNPNRIYHGL